MASFKSQAHPLPSWVHPLFSPVGCSQHWVQYLLLLPQFLTLIVSPLSIVIIPHLLETGRRWKRAGSTFQISRGPWLVAGSVSPFERESTPAGSQLHVVGCMCYVCTVSNQRSRSFGAIEGGECDIPLTAQYRSAVHQQGSNGRTR